MTELAKRATQARRMTLDNRALRRELSDGTMMMQKLIGASPLMERLREDILDLGQADSHVLIDGETWYGQDAGGPCPACRGPARRAQIPDDFLRGLVGRPAFGQTLWPAEDGAVPMVEEPAAAPYVWKTSKA